MNYVMSDLHGCYDEFLEMLELINFSKDDNMVILGDIIDRGPDSVKLIQDLMSRTNIKLIMGNHDWFMHRVLSTLPVDITFGNLTRYMDKKTEYYYMNWMYNKGESTFIKYLNLSLDERTDVLKFLSNLPYYCELIVENQKYILIHSVPDRFSKEKSMEDYTLFDLIFTRIDNDKWDDNFYDDKILIVGHTPTFFIDELYEGKILKKEKIINIDCGCAYRREGGKLGCLRLEDMKEFYV